MESCKVLCHRFLAPGVKWWGDQTKETRKSALKIGYFVLLGLDNERSVLGSNSLSFDAFFPLYKVGFRHNQKGSLKGWVVVFEVL